MKSLFAAAAVMIASLVATAPRAEAGLEISIGWSQSYVSGYADCGCPIYSERVCCGYDEHHHPVFHTHRKPFHCGCKHHAKRDKDARKYYEKREKEYYKDDKKRRKEYEKHSKKHHKKH